MTMINLNEFRENPEKFIQGAKDKQVDIDWDRFKQLEELKRELKHKLDELNHDKNKASEKIGHLKAQGKDSEAEKQIKQVQDLKENIAEIKDEKSKIDSEFRDIYLKIPIPPHSSVPYGENDEDNEPYEFVGDKPEFDFEPVPHWELLEQRDMLDQERSAKVSGSRFFYTRDGLVRLELALVQYAMDKLSSKGFRETMVPNLVRKRAMEATGFLPAEENEIYKVNPGQDDLYLIGTSEVPLTAQHMDEILDKENLPLRYIGFSPCYRREAGSYGKDTKGLIRLHQFNKVEMMTFTLPDNSWKEHEMLVSIQEEIYQELNIPYQKINICSGDLGSPAAKKYDLEAWFPGLGMYKEVTSTSNCLDFQTRRANVKYKDDDGENKYVHSLNGTAIAMTRVLAAIVENYQTKDGKIKIPEVLQDYMGGKEII